MDESQALQIVISAVDAFTPALDALQGALEELVPVAQQASDEMSSAIEGAIASIQGAMASLEGGAEGTFAGIGEAAKAAADATASIGDGATAAADALASAGEGATAAAGATASVGAEAVAATASLADLKRQLKDAIALQEAGVTSPVLDATVAQIRAEIAALKAAAQSEAEAAQTVSASITEASTAAVAPAVAALPAPEPSVIPLGPPGGLPPSALVPYGASALATAQEAQGAMVPLIPEVLPPGGLLPGMPPPGGEGVGGAVALPPVSTGNAPSGRTGMGGTLAGAMAVMAGGGLFAALERARTGFATFQAELAQIGAETGDTNTQLAQMGDQFLQLSQKVPVSADDMAKSMYHVAAVYSNAHDQMAVFNAAIKGAVAGQVPLVDETNALIQVLQSYHLPASQAATVTKEMFAAAARGNINMTDLSTNLKRVATFAGSLHVPLDQLLAAYSMMTAKTGNASLAETELAQVLKQLVAPTKASQKVLGEHNAALIQQTLLSKGLVPAVQMLISVTHGNTAEMVRAVPNIRALLGVLGLAGKGYGKLAADVQNSSALFDHAFNQQMKAAAARMKEFGDTAHDAGLSIGHSFDVIISPLVAHLQSLLSFFAKNKGAALDLTRVLVGLGAALVVVGATMAGLGIANYVAGAFAQLATIWRIATAEGPALAAALDGASAATTALGGALDFMLGPWGLVIAAVVAGAVLIITHWQQVSAFLTKAWQTITTDATAGWQTIKSIAESIGQAFGSAWKASSVYIEVIAAAITGLLLPTMVKMAAQAILSLGQMAIEWGAQAAAAVAQLPAILAAWYAQGAAGIAAAVESATAAVGVVADWVAMAAAAVANAAVMAAQWVIALGPIAWVSAAVLALAVLVVKNWGTIRQATVEVWGDIKDWIMKTGPEIWGALTKPFDDFKTWITNLAQDAYNWGANLIHQFVAGIESAVASVSRAVSSVVSTVKSYLGFHSPTEKGPGAEADQWAPALMQMFAQGVVQGTPTVQAALARVFPATLTGLAGGASGPLSLATSGTVSGTSIHVTVNVQGSVVAERELAEVIAGRLGQMVKMRGNLGMA